jgi:hypothetical protein
MVKSMISLKREFAGAVLALHKFLFDLHGSATSAFNDIAKIKTCFLFRRSSNFFHIQPRLGAIHAYISGDIS